MSDAARLLNDLEVITMTLAPDIDTVKLKIRLEEVTDRYAIELKTAKEMEEDLLDNIRLYISAKRLEGLSELTLADYYRELIIFEYFVNKSTVQITTSDIRQYLANNDEVMASTNAKKTLCH